MTAAPSRLGLLVVAALCVTACYESAFPLDPLPQADIDPALVDTWHCLFSEPSATDHEATLTVGRLRDRVYAVTFQEAGSDPDRYEAHASQVGGATLFNVRDLSAAGTSGKPWVFVRPVFLRPNVLQLQVVEKDALKGVEGSPAAVRKAVERLQGSPALYADFLVCVRQKKD